MEKDLKELAVGLDQLTEEGGPLRLLIDEVRSSNNLALRNVRLQILSLLALFLCLVCLFFLSFVFYQGLNSLSKAEENISILADRLSDTEWSVQEMEEELEDAPKIVADDSGQLKVVATVELEEDFGEPDAAPEGYDNLLEKVQEGVKKEEARLDEIMAERRGVALAQPKKRAALSPPKPKAKSKKIAIPLEMWNAKAE